jgi:hypothetical protein
MATRMEVLRRHGVGAGVRCRHLVMVSLMVLASLIAACGDDADAGSSEPSSAVSSEEEADGEAELPDSESWAADNPQPTGGTPLNLALVTGFDGEVVEVRVDGEPVVAGSWNLDPDDHHCGYGPYSVMTDPGPHKVEVITSSGVELVESFELATESTGNISLRDPPAGPSWMNRQSSGCSTRVRGSVSDGDSACLHAAHEPDWGAHSSHTAMAGASRRALDVAVSRYASWV